MESMSSGETNGSSPWTLTTKSASIFENASIMRSVPERHFSEVIIAGAPILSANSKISMLSVRIATFSARELFLQFSYTRSKTALPPRSASGLPGKRVEPMRAGIATAAPNSIAPWSGEVWVFFTSSQNLRASSISSSGSAM